MKRPEVSGASDIQCLNSGGAYLSSRASAFYNKGR